jgi:hypothetical protein
MSEKNLVKDLQKVAAVKLHSTQGIPRNMKGKIELICLAFGHAEVVEDFEKWCDEKIELGVRPPYPVTEYLRGVDARLGGAQRVEPDDPRIVEIRNLAYELTNVLPPVRVIRDLLLLHDGEDMKKALREYVIGLEGRDMEKAMQLFFNDGGVGSVIALRKKQGL